MPIDKFKTCEGCPDRSVIPNCHSTCEGYLARSEKRRQIREQKTKYGVYIACDREKNTRLYKLMKSRGRKG